MELYDGVLGLALERGTSLYMMNDRIWMGVIVWVVLIIFTIWSYMMVYWMWSLYMIKKEVFKS